MAFRRAYSVDGQAAVASPTKTLLGITGGTTWLACIFDTWIGASAAPADNALLWYYQRSTAAGTSTAFTPVPTGAGATGPGLAANTAAGFAHSAEPTYTSGKTLWHLALNQRATHRANLDPDAPLVVPAASNNGIGLYPVHGSFTGNVDATLWFYES
jgi:hypothetical protein